MPKITFFYYNLDIFPDFREFFQAFIASRVIFGNNDVNNVWLALWVGAIMAAAMAVAAAAAPATAASFV